MDQQYVADVTKFHREMLESTETQDSRIAYFCMEFGLAGFLKLYSGGLGILAGDHLKASSDLNLPLCAVGLAYHDGYFHQIIDREGHQEAGGDTNDFESPPFEPVMVGRYAPLRVTVQLPTGPVQVRAWKLQVGRIRSICSTPTCRRIGLRIARSQIDCTVGMSPIACGRR